MTSPRLIHSSGPADPWSPYEPTAKAPWDLRRVVHLHRRAGFAATWAEINRDLADGPRSSVDRVLNGTSRLGGVPDDFEATATLLADAAVTSSDPNRLKAWWVYRMVHSPDPLAERLTLLWHGHFATAFSKVEDLALMLRQNETFRRHARGSFGALLGASLREPALLLYLDAPTNSKVHPNENLARELMELFTLGVGSFSEKDVQEAARALTGWTVESGAFRDHAAKHDDGDKTILGRSTKANGADLLALLLEQPATSRRVAHRLASTFLGEGAVDDTAIDSLATLLKNQDLHIGRAVETILRSRAFFDVANLGSRVLGPVEFVVGAVRALVVGTSPSTLLLADWASRLGQDLFEPPNVGGWPGGRAWLSGRSIVARANFAAALVEGRGVGLSGPLEVRGLVEGQSSSDAARALLLGLAPLGSKVETSPQAARRAVALTLASPEAQLG